MYPPHSYGGYEQSCRDVVTRWRAVGHRVEVLTSDLRVGGALPVDDAGDGPEEGVRRRLHLYWADHDMISPPLWTRRRWEAANRAALDAALAECRPQVVSAWAMGAMSLGLLTRVAARGLPVVSVVCDEWPVYGPEADAWLRPLFRRPRLAEAVRRLTGLPGTLPPLDQAGPACFVSRFLLERCRRDSPWSFPEASVVYSGLAGGEFPYRPEPTGRPFGWRLLHVGRIDPRKGIDVAVRAAAACPAGTTLRVLGDGDPAHRAALAALAGELGLGERVTFGSAPRGSLADAYHSSDALVFCPRWEEPFGLVPLESMACGTPVVASPTGGSAEFLCDGYNCLCVPRDDPGAVAAALYRLAREPGLRSRLAEGGRATAAALGVDELAASLEAWHRWAVEPAGRARPPERRLPGISSGG